METVRRKLGYVDPDLEVDKDTSNHIGGHQIRQRNTGKAGWLPANAIDGMDCRNAQLGGFAQEPGKNDANGGTL